MKNTFCHFTLLHFCLLLVLPVVRVSWFSLHSARTCILPCWSLPPDRVGRTRNSVPEAAASPVGFDMNWPRSLGLLFPLMNVLSDHLLMLWAPSDFVLWLNHPLFGKDFILLLLIIKILDLLGKNCVMFSFTIKFRGAFFVVSNWWAGRGCFAVRFETTEYFSWKKV